MSDIIEALLEERRGYEVRGRKDRVAEVDKALADAGHKPVKKAAAKKADSDD